MVGARGFEPPTPSPPAKCATRLRHAPTLIKVYILIIVYLLIYFYIDIKDLNHIIFIMSAHDYESKLASDAILNNFRIGSQDWNNNFISNQAHYIKSTQKFPSPDRSFYCPDLYTRIALEFKPAERESKRGILTGLGQTLAYLANHPDKNLKINDASYLIIPEIIDDFEIGSFLEDIFKNHIFGKLPIGLVTFKNDDPSAVKLRCNISNTIKTSFGINYEEAINSGYTEEKAIKHARDSQFNNEYKNKNFVTYWAAWRENYPHDVYYLLKTAINNTTMDPGKRKKEIWDKFYYSYYCYPPNTIDTLKIIPNKLLRWGEEEQSWGETNKRILKKSVDDGKDNLTDALTRLKWAAESDSKAKKKYWDKIQNLSVLIPANSSDNDYTDMKKNKVNGPSHTGLWDNDTFEISEIGKRYIKHFEKYKDPVRSLICVYIGSGKYDELILDIIKYQEIKKNEIQENISSYKDDLKNYFIKKGLIGLNPNRSTTGDRKFLQSELQLLKRGGIYINFIPKQGLIFDMQKLRDIKKEFNSFFNFTDWIKDSILEIEDPSHLKEIENLIESFL